MLTSLLILDKRAFGNNDLIVPMIGTEITVVIGTFVVSPGKDDRSGMTTINRRVFASAMVSGSWLRSLVHPAAGGSSGPPGGRGGRGSGPCRGADAGPGCLVRGRGGRGRAGWRW